MSREETLSKTDGMGTLIPYSFWDMREFIWSEFGVSPEYMRNTVEYRVMEQLVLMKTRPKDTIVIPFFGYGSFACAALDCGRRVLGIANDKEDLKEAHDNLEQLIGDSSLLKENLILLCGDVNEPATLEETWRLLRPWGSRVKMVFLYPPKFWGLWGKREEKTVQTKDWRRLPSLKDYLKRWGSTVSLWQTPLMPGDTLAFMAEDTEQMSKVAPWRTELYPMAFLMHQQIKESKDLVPLLENIVIVGYKIPCLDELKEQQEELVLDGESLGQRHKYLFVYRRT